MSAARSVIAHFEVIPTYALTTFAAPPAGGTISGGGTYQEGTAVTVTATPSSGYVFARWFGACTGDGACSVTMNGNRSVTARFVRTYALTVGASPSGGGSVSGGGTYNSGAVVAVTATPGAGYAFDRWSGDCTGSGACSVTMNAPRSVTAHFVRAYALTVTASPSAGGSVSGGGTYDSGTNVTVTATANSGYRFDRWSGDCTGTGTCSVTMSAARSVTAHFVARYVLTASASPSGGGSVTGSGTYDSGDERHGHGHGEQRLPLRPLVGGLHGLRNLLRHHVRHALRDGAFRRALRPHRQRLAVRRRERQRRGHVRCRGARHRHGQSEQRLPFRPLVGRLHGLRELFRHDERGALRDGAFRARATFSPPAPRRPAGGASGAGARTTPARTSPSRPARSAATASTAGRGPARGRAPVPSP